MKVVSSKNGMKGKKVPIRRRHSSCPVQRRP